MSTYTMIGTTNIYTFSLNSDGVLLWDAFLGGDRSDIVRGISISYDDYYIIIGGSTLSRVFDGWTMMSQQMYATLYVAATGRKVGTRVTPTPTPDAISDIKFSSGVANGPFRRMLTPAFGNDAILVKFNINGDGTLGKAMG